MSHTETDSAASKAVLPDLTFRLIYRSQSRIPAAQLDTELGNILRVARTRNAANGITGALLLYDD